MLAARLEPPPAVVLAARSGSGALDLCSARSLLKADSINRHCSLDSKLRSIKLKGQQSLLCWVPATCLFCLVFRLP